jgi:hypothetical protein
MQESDRKKFATAGARAIGALTASMLDPIARARGFAATALLTEWRSIVGEELAAFSAPDRIIWPRRTDDGEAPPPSSAWRADGAILVLKVEGPRAIEMQHRSGQILERINVYFGYRAIAQLRFLQAPISRPAKQAAAGAAATPEACDTASIPAGIDDEGLRQALARLRSAVAALRRG